MSAHGIPRKNEVTDILLRRSSFEADLDRVMPSSMVMNTTGFLVGTRYLPPLPRPPEHHEPCAIHLTDAAHNRSQAHTSLPSVGVATLGKPVGQQQMPTLGQH